MIDDRTAHYNLPKPHVDNAAQDDVIRIRSALDAIDTAIFGRADAVHSHTIADVTGLSGILAGKEEAANKGQPNGYASLGGDGKVPAGQLPSYVDDVLEVPNFAALPVTGEAGKIYVLLAPHTVGSVTSSQFRWSGSSYIPIVASPGTTDAVVEGVANLYFTEARARSAQLPATAGALGVVKIGSGLGVDLDGTIFVTSASGSVGVPAFNEVVLTPSTNGQTAFTPAGGYEAGFVDLYLNGVLLFGGGIDYTAADGVNITLGFGVQTTDSLLLKRWTTATNLAWTSITGKPTTLAGLTSDMATQAEMEAGALATAKTMSPLRVRQAIAAQTTTLAQLHAIALSF